MRGGALIGRVDDRQLGGALVVLQQMVLGAAAFCIAVRLGHTHQVHEPAVLPHVARQLAVEAVLLHHVLRSLYSVQHPAAGSSWLHFHLELSQQLGTLSTSDQAAAGYTFTARSSSTWLHFHRQINQQLDVKAVLGHTG